jgi:hypothetical protein
VGLLAFVTGGIVAEDRKEQGKGISLQLGKIEEMETKSKLSEPQFGYVGQLGSFTVCKEGQAMGAIVVHSYPNTEKSALGCTKLTYEGTKRLGNVDGWVFKTEWDGKGYPSKIFFSAEPVYFGGGINAYIAADYRDESGWAWKLHPLRRMEIVKNGSAGRE